MAAFSYDNSAYSIRPDLQQAYRDYWQTLAKPGNWWRGEERIAIAQEVRNATQCGHCQQRKQALSPYNFHGQHLSGTSLDEATVDAVHRVVTDQNRITQSWIEQLAELGMPPEKYVELVGVVVALFSIDEFNRALGLELEPLPIAEVGEPDHYRPAQASHVTGFVPMLPEDGATGRAAASDLAVN